LAAKAAGRAFLYVPNFCIAEAMCAFAKKCWQEKLYGTGSGARNAFNEFRDALLEHVVSSKILYSFELSRRHLILAHNVYERAATISSSLRSGKPLSTLDVLMISMGLDLMNVHGKDNLYLVTAERPIYDVCCANRADFPRALNVLEQDIPAGLQ
jgi:hypothetical protein